MNVWSDDVLKEDENRQEEGVGVGPTALVWTSDGYKTIDNLVESDSAWVYPQGQADVRSVESCWSNEVCRINAMLSDDIVTAPDQLFYAIKHNRRWSHERRRELVSFGAPEWVKAKDLDRSYYIGAMVNQESLSIAAETPADTAIMSSLAFWYVMGVFVKEGWRTHDEGVSAFVNMPTIQFLLNTLDSIDWTYEISKDTKGYQLTLHHRTFIESLNQVGSHRQHQHLPHNWIRMPKEQVLSFVSGFFYAHTDSEPGQMRVLRHPNREFVHGLAQSVAKAYGCPYGIYDNKGSSLGGFRLQFSPHPPNSVGGFHHNGVVWSPVYQSVREHYAGELYNIEIAGDDGYTINHAITKHTKTN